LVGGSVIAALCCAVMGKFVRARYTVGRCVSKMHGDVRVMY
jgi:hypothetical protein